MPNEEGAYVDEKGRTRWRRNDEIAEFGQRLGHFRMKCVAGEDGLAIRHI